MSQLCDYLIQGCIAADCTDPIYAGMNSVGYIANFDEIAAMTWADANTVNGITMATGKQFYKVQQLGNEPFTGTGSEMTTSTYGNKFNKTVVVAIADNSPAAGAMVDSLANGKFVFIGQNDYKKSDGSAKYEIYGAKKGLKASSIVREAYGDNEGMWIVTLQETNSPISSAFFYLTDEATTDAALTGQNGLVGSC